MTGLPPESIFLQEARELLEDCEQVLMDIEQTPDDPELLNRLFRNVHTIKGSGAMYGFVEVSRFTHHVETLLDHVRKGRVGVTGKLIDLILNCRDHIQALLAIPPETRPDDSGEQWISEIRNWIPEEPAASGPSRSSVKAASPVSGTSRFSIRLTPSPDILKTGLDPALLIRELRDMGDCGVAIRTGAVPPLYDMDPESCYLAWDIDLITHAPLQAIQDVFAFIQDDSDITISPVEEAPFPADSVPREEPAEASSAPVSAASPAGRPASAAENQSGSVRVSSDKLDTLINLVGELLITRERFQEVCSALEDFDKITLYNELSKMTRECSLLGFDSESLKKALDLTDSQMDPMRILDKIATGLESPLNTIRRLCEDLRDCALDMRMVPIGTIFRKFRRLVRDLSASTGKEIALVTEGGDTELDKTLMDRITDPLIHLIRNSIDHGIQSPEDRRKAGKPEAGVIRLTATHREANIVIAVEDDGKGLDAERIREKALADWIITEEDALSEEDVYKLIFLPGFSTAKEVTQISGRGVGMDAVKRGIEAIGGAIHIDTRKGEYLRIELSLPLTLAIVNSLLVEVGGGLFGIPLAQIYKCMEMRDAALKKSGSQDLILMDDRMVPYIRLRELFRIPGPPPDCEHLIIVETDGVRFGLVADRILNDVQAVIKPLRKDRRTLDRFSGATVLGDGKVALFMDIKGIMAWALQDQPSMRPSPISVPKSEIRS